MGLSIFEPYYNAITVGDDRYILAWCNQTMLESVKAYTLLTGEYSDDDFLMSNLSNPNVFQAVLLGALTVANPGNGERFFLEILKGAKASQLIDVVTVGVSEYCRIVSSVEFGELDESYPDTVQKTDKQNEVGWLIGALKKHGYSLAEISRMRYSGMQYALSVATGEELQTQKEIIEGLEDV